MVVSFRAAFDNIPYHAATFSSCSAAYNTDIEKKY